MLFLVTIVTLLSYVSCEYKYETKWFEVPLDHFGYQRNETFKIKYLVNESYWDRGNGPIFFYTGNEGQIEVFAKHTGFMWDIAQEFKAKLVFAEHRYYGQSMPFGNKSLDNAHIGYLTSSQALADYADLVNFLQGNDVTPVYPVIAFGGSYGGMLAAYFRIKYPHVVAGAIAASAPVHMYPGMIQCQVFNNIASYSYWRAGKSCFKNIRNSWSVIRNYTKTANGSEWLQKNWRLCDPVKTPAEVDVLVDFLVSMYTTLSMVNYPYPSDFLVPLPAYPVRVVCLNLDKPLEGQKLLEGIGKVLETYTNYNHNNKCVDYKKGDDYGNLDASGWDYQACTEMVMPTCATGEHDMFEPSPWNFTDYSETCRKKYGVVPQPEGARITYGGLSLLQAATNIVFSNGMLDPWSAGGILYSPSETVKAVIIPNTAHHLDLMAASKSDPETVRMARGIHKQNIEAWINGFHAKNKAQRRPQY